MPKAGRYEYPAYDLDTCMERLRKIYEVSKTNVIKKETAAEIIGMSPKSGATGSFFASLAMYGLIEYRNGSIEITDLAKKILFGAPDEIAAAKRNAVRNIQLFADIFDQYGASVTEEQLRVFLRDKALVDMPKIPELIEEISKIYKKVVPYLVPPEKTKVQIPSIEVAERKEAVIVPEVPGAKALSVRYGEYNIFTIPVDQLDDEIINLVITTLKDTLNYIKKLEERRKQGVKLN
ncbi:MAG: hypothetical protein QXY75_05885 [Candidatus Bathyarchaeia archaeon]